MTLGPGEVLGDRYTLRKIEWSTPLGPMWSARDRVLDRSVFIQVLAGSVAADKSASRAFQKAAARTAQATHPGVLQVFDIGDSPPFVVFEHAPGGRLSQRLQAGPMRTTDVARSILAIARGLEALHERAAWHGALSPETVLFDGEGRPKLLATGLGDTARAAATVDTAAEQPASYRPPEEGAAPADADRYALAALAYHMLTGKPPQRGQSARQLRRSVPDEIDVLLQRALSPTAAERPTLDEFEAALAPFARVEPKTAREPRIGGGEFRWLFPVAVILALAVAAATVGVEFVKGLANPDDAQPSRTAAPAAPRLLRIDSATDFDPFGANKAENSNDVDLALDEDEATAWKTECYRQSDLGEKPGVGLLFDLGTTRRLRSMRLQTELPGWTAEIRVGDDAPDGPEDFRLVREMTAELEQRVALSGRPEARYVLLWITALVETPDRCSFPFRAEVAEVSFFA